MSGSYAAIKTADAALPGSPLPLATAVAELNAQTTVLPPQDITVASAQAVLLLAPTGDWLKLEAQAAMTISSLTAPTQGDQVTMAAKLALALVSGPVQTIQASQPSVLSAWNGFMGVLVAAGVISSESQAEIQALITPTVPLWQPAITVADLATIRSSG